MGEAIVFTSGKGGVGKTTAIANIGAGLSQLDKKVVMLDTDMGLRNLDVVMGLEDRISYNLLDLLENRCRLGQALIRDKRYPNLFMIPAALGCKDISGYEARLQKLVLSLKAEFDYCLIDCPAGIDAGFRFAIAGADRAIIVTTPHISAVRDAGRVIYLLEENRFLKLDLLINLVDEKMIRKHNMLSQADVEDVLGMKCIGTVSADDHVVISQNLGSLIIGDRSRAAREFRRIARRIDTMGLVPAELSDEAAPRRNRMLFRRKELKYEIS